MSLRIISLLFIFHTFYSYGTSVSYSGFKRQSIQTSYDFVVIGGGTAGLALASRLSEYQNQTILVLEAGQLPTIVNGYINTGYNQFVTNTYIDYDFSSKPETTLDGQVLTYHRGRCVGGSSSINGEAYFRGSASIYDSWEALGNPGWGWKDVYSLFVKSTTWAPTPAYDNNYTTHDPSAYSDGPIQVGFAGYKVPSSVGFVQACPSIGVPIVAELNNGSSIGVTQGTATVDSDFQRSGSYDGYYAQARNRSNLHVLNLAAVQRIIFDQSTTPVKAVGVVYMDQTSGSLYNVTANKEVILSAGAFQSPQLLMISGIGPSKALQMNGIPPVLINENIGQNLQDNPIFGIQVRSQASASVSEVYNDYMIQYNEEVAWQNNRSGRLTVPSGVTNGFYQLSGSELMNLTDAADLQNRLDQSHLEFSYTSSFYPVYATPQYTPLTNESYFTVSASVLAPTSRGNVTIQSANPSDAPVFQLNYYETKLDQQIAILGFKKARTLLSSPYISQYSIGPNNGEVSPGPSVQSDEDILSYIKATTIPNWHVCGTLAMLPQNMSGVVDSRLRLYNVQGLRVVDTSIFPVVPDANIIAATYMVAEKAALLIEEDYGL